MLRAAVVAVSCLVVPAEALLAQEATTPPAPAEAGRLEALESAVRTLTAENERLRQAEAAASPPAAATSPDPAVARAADLERQLAAAQEQRAAAERQAATSQDERAATQQQLAQAQQDRMAVEQRLAQAEQQRQAAEQRLATAQEEVRRLGTERDAVAGQVRQLSDELAAARAEAGRAGEQASARAEEATRELAARDEQAGRLRADLLAARNDLGAAEGQLQSRTKEVEALTVAARELVAGQEASADELAGLRRELAEAQAMVARLQHAQAERDALATNNEGVRERLFAAVREALGPSDGPTPEGDRLILPTDLAFRPASAVLPPSARARVVEVGRALAKAAGSMPPGTEWLLQVEGHTDRTRTGGRVFSSNRALAAARAVTVAEALAEGGVPAEHLAAVGFGEFRPLDAGDSDEALRRNRRIELRVIDG